MRTSGFSEFSDGPSAFASISNQPVTPVPSSSYGISGNAAASVQPAVDSTTPASPFASATPLPISGDAGFSFKNVGSSAFEPTSSQPTPVVSSSSGFSNNTGPSIQPAVGTTTPASLFAATSTPFGPSIQSVAATTTPAISFASATPFGPSIQPVAGTTTPASPFAATTPFGPSIQPVVGTTSPASPFASATPLCSGVFSLGGGGDTFGGGGSSPLFGVPSQPSQFRSSSSFGFLATASPLFQPAVDGFVLSATPSHDLPRRYLASWCEPPSTPITQPGAGMLLSISAMPVYEDKSHEELMWIDYQVGDKGNSAFGSPPNQPPTWGGFQSSIFGSPSYPRFGVRASAAPVSGSSAFESATPYIRPRWGSRVASYTPTVELDQPPHYPQLGEEKQINVPEVGKVRSEGNQLDASSCPHCPAESQDKQTDEQMDKKKMQDLRKVVELESEVERCVSANVPKVDRVRSKGKQIDASSSTHCPAIPQDKDKKKMQDLRKAIELECEVERRVSVKHIAFLTCMLEKLDNLSI